MLAVRQDPLSCRSPFVGEGRDGGRRQVQAIAVGAGPRQSPMGYGMAQIGHSRGVNAAAWFPAEARSVIAARHFAQHAATALGQPPDFQQTVALLVTELASNAVRHAQSEFLVHLTSDEDVVRCEVRDHDAHLPEKSDPTPDDEGGRGLLFVDSLSSRWGADPISGDGKTVWFEVPLE